MAAVVFMRGVNVGGRKRFRPAALAEQLSALDVANIGAAGTFVVRAKVSEATLRAEFQGRLPFEAELMICPARDLIDLASADPFPPEASQEGVRRYLSVLGERPAKKPRLPLRHPAAERWQVKVVGLRGRFALSLWRRVGKTNVYPNGVVETELAVPATTRNWNTIARICDILQDR